jgi:hypothetical protein
VPAPFTSRQVWARPAWLTDLSTWHGHIPFAFYVVELARPKVLVELGTHGGDSYCAFCQAVDELGLETRCWAVDTWQGDQHIGPYTSEVLDRLRDHHHPLYGHFSQLRESTFDAAVDSFDDGSIDLLHIDGTHTYDAVTHDFDTWSPKLSDQGVVLLHDTQERAPDFGVWRLWNELQNRYPSFEFTHGHGLGVLAVGKRPLPPIAAFLEEAEARPDQVRGLFGALGERASLLNQRDRLRSRAEELEAELEPLAMEARTSTVRAQAAEARLAAIQSSTSWRLTAWPRKLRERLTIH